MVGKLFPDNRVYADEDEVENKHKGGPTKHWDNPSLDVLLCEEGSLTEEKTSQHVLVLYGKPIGDMPPEQIPPIILLCIEPERVCKCTDQLVHARVSGHCRHHNDHDVNDQKVGVR